MPIFQSPLKAGAVIERIRTNSVLNPLLWLCGIISITALPIAHFETGAFKIWFIIIASTPIISAILAYSYFMITDPNRLQSEEYQLQRQLILQGSKENDTVTITSQTQQHPINDVDYATAMLPDDTMDMITSNKQQHKNGEA